jgi:RHS repeat-associated protein
MESIAPNKPAQRLEFACDDQSRRINKKVFGWSAGRWTLSSDLRFLYDGWNLIAELAPSDLGPPTSDLRSPPSAPSIFRSYLWGLDLSGSMQGAGGIGGLLGFRDVSSQLSSLICYDGNGNVVNSVDARSGVSAGDLRYDPFGRIADRAPLAPVGFSSKYSDRETGLLYYGFRYYSSWTGRWLSRDPIGEAGGENLFLFSGNDPVNLFDVLGLSWNVQRNTGYRASAKPTDGEMITQLARRIGLDEDDYENWLAPIGNTPMPSSKYQVLNHCMDFEIPNTVYAYWAGNCGGVGKWAVSWSPSVSYLGSLGFCVIQSDHPHGTTLILQQTLQSAAASKHLHGLYFWGHGFLPFPSTGLACPQGEAEVWYNQINLVYRMALGLVFACDSNSGAGALSAWEIGTIWHGYTGTLIPSGYYGVEQWIQYGNQETK